jgi:hypothetical protein
MSKEREALSLHDVMGFERIMVYLRKKYSYRYPSPNMLLRRDYYYPLP